MKKKEHNAKRNQKQDDEGDKPEFESDADSGDDQKSLAPKPHQDSIATSPAEEEVPPSIERTEPEEKSPESMESHGNQPIVSDSLRSYLKVLMGTIEHRTIGDEELDHVIRRTKERLRQHRFDKGDTTREDDP